MAARDGRGQKAWGAKAARGPPPQLGLNYGCHIFLTGDKCGNGQLPFIGFHPEAAGDVHPLLVINLHGEILFPRGYYKFGVFNPVGQEPPLP